MPESSNPFTEIFKRLTAEEFIEDPTRILSLMMDFGFDSRHVKILRVAMSEDMKEVREFLECTVDSENEIIGNISEYCLVSQKALTDMLGGIKSSMYGGVETRIIDDEKYGRCRISADGIAKYSLDMTMLHRVANVDSFTIPDSVTEIGKFALSRCTSLNKVTIPDSVTEIRWYAFSGCTSLKEVYIPDSVTEIGDGAFTGCESLKEVHILNSVTTIGWDAFRGCTSLKEVHLPDSVTKIRYDAFRGCTSLKEVHIPDSVTEIGDGAFKGCTSVHLVVDAENEFYCSESGALFDKEKETLISGYALVRDGVCDIPDSVTEIRDDAFTGCESLKEVHIPDSVTEIGGYAFEGCTSLKEVHIPDSVTEIGSGAFEGCTSVHFIVDAGNEFYCSVSGALFDKEKETLISGYALVQDGVCDIPDSVTEIGESAFSDCTSLKEVHIPDSVRKIDGSIFGGAFSGCKSLKEVRIPDSVTEIGGYAFEGCTSLKEVHIPDSVTEIVKRAFEGCTSVNFIVDSNNKPR